MKPILSQKIIDRDPTELRARPDNARTHSRRQKRALAAIIRRVGFLNPVLIDRHDVLIAGHARVEVAIELGLTSIPAICIAHLTEAELQAYVIADNRTAEMAGWDRELLAQNFASIELLDGDFDMSLTGFDLEQIDLLRDCVPIAESSSSDNLPPVRETAVSMLGDIWEVDGHHLILCGDATEEANYRNLMGLDRADLVITDPPWNCPIEGHVSGLGKHKHREFVAASGELSPEQFRRFLTDFMVAAGAVSRSGAVHYIFCDWRILSDVLTVGDGAYDQLLNLAVWAKTNAGMGSFLRSQHELIAIFRKGRRRHINNVNLGADGRYRSNLWTFAGANSFGAGRDDALAMHPTSKPVALIAEAIKDASHRDDIVLDPFGGSGTTLIASHETGRRARLMELDPLYVDVIVKRAAHAGLAVNLMATGQSFEQVSNDRVGGHG